MAASQARMAKLTHGLSSKSEKMRVLARAGYGRGDIARFLGTSYQFVRNVLLQEEARQAKQVSSDAPDPAKAGETAPAKPASRRAKVGAEGEIILPPHIRDAMRLKEGDELVATLEDGELRLLTLGAAIRKAQAIVRQFVPNNVSLVDELLEDRRREVERENQND